MLKLPEPWFGFLRDIDDFVTGETHLHCLGGFVVTVIYGASRSTSDIDFISTALTEPELLDHAGEGGPLHKRHKVFLDQVGIAQLPENYKDRLTEIFPDTFERLRLFALDPYDIALSKIERNIERDREDVKHLARVIPLDLEILKQRYYDELRVYVRNEGREDLTLKLWTEMIEEIRGD